MTPEEKRAKMAYIRAKHKIIVQAMANGGVFVEDCAPWAVKEGCTRTDCPMRQLAIYEANPDHFFALCDPIGIMADVLLTLKATQDKGA